MMRNQFAAFNIENPEADSEKGAATNSALFLNNDTSLYVKIYETQYRIERDEEAFMKQMRNNMASQAEMEAFLAAKAGGIGSIDGKTLDDLLPKKKIPVPNRPQKIVFEGPVDIASLAKGANQNNKHFKLSLNKEFAIEGDLKLHQNQFTSIPRGFVTLNIEQMSAFKKDRFETYKDLVILFTQKINQSGEKMVQRINEADLEKTVKFECFHYDEFIKVEVFHRNSEQKNSKLAKAFIHLRQLTFSEDETIPFSVDLKPSNYGEKRD